MHLRLLAVYVFCLRAGYQISVAKELAGIIHLILGHKPVYFLSDQKFFSAFTHIYINI